MRSAPRFLATLLLVAGVFGAGVYFGRVAVPLRAVPEPRTPLEPLPCLTALPALPEGLSGEEKRDIDVFRRASASVVFITSLAVQRDVFSFDEATIPQGTGSGFVAWGVEVPTPVFTLV